MPAITDRNLAIAACVLLAYLVGRRQAATATAQHDPTPDAAAAWWNYASTWGN